MLLFRKFTLIRIIINNNYSGTFECKKENKKKKAVSVVKKSTNKVILILKVIVI